MKNFTLLLNQLNPEKNDLSGLNDELDKRAQKVVENIKNLGLKDYFTPEDLIAANPNLNFLILSDIFSKQNGLKLNEEAKFEAAGLLKDDAGDGDSREERCF